METPSPGPEHEHFISWAKDQLGVTIDGVTPTKLPGRGLGVLATKPLKQGDLLVSVPAKSLLTIESKHVKDVRLPKEATVHGRLAAYLTLTSAKGDAPHRIWESVWPKKEEFEAIMPMNWEELQKELLPAHAKSLLEKQQAKFEVDWELLKDHLPDKDCRDLFTYYWMVVNTRTFYWDYPTTTRTGKQQVKRRKLDPDDCMALCPFMEYFNHADEGNQDGFILDTNKWDETKLDHIIIPKLSKTRKEALDDRGFLGNYTIDPSQPCFRTQVVLRALALPGNRWRAFSDGFDEGADEREDVDGRLVEILKQYEREVDKKRWGQIRNIVEELLLEVER
ncbi:hypothetical protein SLS57_001298 [Botryosphaeria dothidea]